MGSDRARNTYDASRQYRSVVAQQGRVVIEADLNEAQQIAAEELRQEALDFVGPHGTPTPDKSHDDGYQVFFNAQPPGADRPNDFEVKAGTMYVGGMRVTLPEPTSYWGQHATEWVDLPAPTGELTGTWYEFVYLHLREQEVSAVEDQNLREVALGGPDTSQRTRLIQHIVRSKIEPPSHDKCTSAIHQANQGHWKDQGLAFDAKTMRLLPLPTTTLQVGFVSPASKQGSKPECEPAPQAGYLGAENQLIRVQISQGKKLLWAYDNASHLYRVDVDENKSAQDNLVVTLRSGPVDAFHHPKPNQIVEVLGAAVQLAHQDEYMAAHTGELFTLSKPYDPDTRKLTLPIKQMKEESPAFFVRIWEQEPTPDQAGNLVLGNTGVSVRLKGGAPGDYWMFALRPSTPQKLYPDPAQAPAQPPDGPRQWACPLAVIEWNKTGDNPAVGKVLADCRLKFDNLVELTQKAKTHELQITNLTQKDNTHEQQIQNLTQKVNTHEQQIQNLTQKVNTHEQEIENLKKRPTGGGCCTITVGPTDLNKTPLPNLLSELVSARKDGEHITVCLRSGTYKLKSPLRLSATEHFTIEGCGHAVLEVEPTHENQFLDGVIVLENVKDITLRGLEIKIPRVPFKETGASLGGIAKNAPEFNSLKEYLETLSVGIGIRLVKGIRVTIEDCRLDAAALSTEPFFSAGLFANDTCTGLEVRNNHFTASAMAPSNEDWKRMAFGYLHTPSTELEPITLQQTTGRPRIPLPTLPSAEKKTLNGAVTQSQLDEASFLGNQFSNLSAAVFIHANPGTVRLERNRVRDCYSGFWLMSLHASAHAGVTSREGFIEPFMTDKINDFLENNLSEFDSSYQFFTMGLMLLTDILVLVGSTLARGYPLPSGSKSLLLKVNGAETGKDFLDSSLQNLFDFANQGSLWFSPVADVAFVPPPDTGTEVTPVQYQGLDSRFGLLHRVLAALEKQLPSPSAELLPSLHVSDNDIEAGHATFTRSTALTVWHAEMRSKSGPPPQPPSWSLVLSANRLWSRSSLLPTARILNVDQSTVMGNMLINRPQSSEKLTPWSLFLIPGKQSGHPAAVAITGNVFIGQAALPKREGAQLPSWQQLNTLRNS